MFCLMFCFYKGKFPGDEDLGSKGKCFDVLPTKKCERKAAKGKCKKTGVQKKCAKSCGLC